MTGIEQIVAHLFGDYVLQSHWMAQRKTEWWWPAAIHAGLYGLPFALVGASLPALGVIIASHFVIDRWRLAKYVVWLKNQVAPSGFRPSSVGATGYSEDVPVWLAVWLLIWADNAIHLAINMVALRAFP